MQADERDHLMAPKGGAEPDPYGCLDSDFELTARQDCRHYLPRNAVTVFCCWLGTGAIYIIYRGSGIDTNPNLCYFSTGLVQLVACLLVLVPTLIHLVTGTPMCFYKKTREWTNHPSRKIVLCRLGFDALLAISMVASLGRLPSQIIPDECSKLDVCKSQPQCGELCFETWDRCDFTGALAQAGLSGSLGYFFVLCFDLWLSVHNSFKQETMFWPYHFIPWGWALLTSLAPVFANDSTLFGVSVAQFCWVRNHDRSGVNGVVWLIMFIPCILVLVASGFALWHAHHCKKSFPNWQKDYQAFRMHCLCVALFFASWLPVACGWALFVLPSKIDTKYLASVLASAMACKAVVDCVLWWWMVYAPPAVALAPRYPVPPPLFRAQHELFLRSRLQEYYKSNGEPAPASEPFVDNFVPILWKHYVHLKLQELQKAPAKRSNRHVRRTWNFVRQALWYQLMVRYQRHSGNFEALHAECEREDRRDDDEYMGNMCKDYVRSVELALFDIALEGDRSRYRVSRGVEQQGFGPVPGFSTAEYNDYCPRNFSAVRQLRGWTAQQFAQSVCKLERTSHAGGTQVQMLRTHDRRFLVKQITEKERDKLLSMVEEYVDYLENRPNSLIARIVGCTAIRMHPQSANIYFIVMENCDFPRMALCGGTNSSFSLQSTDCVPLPLSPSTAVSGSPRSLPIGEPFAEGSSPDLSTGLSSAIPTPIFKFDLKGSWINRETKSCQETTLVDLSSTFTGDPSSPTSPASHSSQAKKRAASRAVGKDKDLEALHYKRKQQNKDPLFWNGSLPDDWWQQLMCDVEFLARNNITDYSLLVIVYERPLTCCLAIIDFLQNYNLEKKAEVLVKTLRYRSCCARDVGYSAAAPEYYKRRFLHNVKRLLQNDDIEISVPLTNPTATVSSAVGQALVPMTDSGAICASCFTAVPPAGRCACGKSVGRAKGYSQSS